MSIKNDVMEKRISLGKALLLILLRVVIVIAICLVALIVILSVTEYKPDDVEPVEI